MGNRRGYGDSRSVKDLDPIPPKLWSAIHKSPDSQKASRLTKHATAAPWLARKVFMPNDSRQLGYPPFASRHIAC